MNENAVAAATRDPRFPPVTLEELELLTIEVSLLTAPQPLEFEDEAHALSLLRPGIDGLIFESQGRRATFLPQVWEDLPEPRQFIEQLKQKAGFARDYWAGDVKLSRYGAFKFQE